MLDMTRGYTIHRYDRLRYGGFLRLGRKRFNVKGRILNRRRVEAGYARWLRRSAERDGIVIAPFSGLDLRINEQDWLMAERVGVGASVFAYRDVAPEDRETLETVPFEPGLSYVQIPHFTGPPVTVF